MQVHSARGPREPRDRPASAPGAGVSGRRPKRRASVEGHARGEEDVRDADTDADTEVLAVQGSAKRRVKFVEGASNFAPRGSAQQAARFARQQCQHRLQVATTLRRGDRLSPRSAKLYRPSSAQVNFQRSPVGNLQVLYPPTTEVLSMVRKFDEEEPEVDQEALAEQAAEAEAEETPTETASTGGVQDLDIHLRNIWFMYQEQEEAADEKDKALLHALRGPDQEDREEALLNEMKLLKTGEDAIAFFAKHGDQSDLQVIHCVSARVEEGKFRPYDLVVVDEKEKGNEYFMISPKGIVHVSPGKQSEHTTLTSWMHQVMIFTVLVSMSFFRNYLTGRAFQRWRSGASNQIYAKHRQSLSRRLFLAKPIFADAQVKVHEILRSLSFTRLLALDGHHNAMGALELRPFLVQQRELCDRVDLDTTAEAACEVLDDAIKKVMNSAELFNQEDPKLLKMLSGRNVSVFAKRQAAEREAYRQKLCAFNQSLVGSFVRLVDVIQQSCLVDLAASKACSLLERFARTSKLFLVSPTFGEAKASGDEKGIPLGLEPGKEDFQDGMQQVLEQIVAVCKVPNVTSYRKYMRHFKEDPAPAIPTDVIHNNPVFRTTLQGLMKQIESDFEKAHQFGESHFAVVYKIHLHSLSWDTDAFGRAKHTHDTLARGMSEMQVFDKHLQKLTTKHPVGFLSIEVTALRDAMVAHVKLSVKAMQSKLSELALETCKKAAVRYHEVNQKLQERPKNLDELVEYVRSFKRIGGEVADLEALKTSVEDMYATLAQHNIRSAPADDFQRDLMSQRAMTFENDAMPGAQFFVNEQEDSACTEVASRYNAAEQEVEDLQDEIIGGMAADPTFLPEAPEVQKYLDEVGNKLDQFEETFKYLNDCYVLFMQEPGDVDMLEEAQATWKKRYELWGIAVQWLNTTARISSESLVRVDVSKIRCQLQGFLQVPGVLSEDLATDAVVLELLDTVDAWFAHRVPVLAIMTGPAMGPQHWTEVVGSFSDAESIKVNSLDFILSGGVMSEEGRKNLTNASAKAAEEHSLLTTVRTIVEAWEHVEMDLKEPEDTEAPWLLKSQDDMLDLLYEDITALQQVLQSPASAIQTEAREISGKLGRACDVLKDFGLLQVQYSLLEPLFRLKVLGEDEASDRVVEKFNASDEAWRLLMHRAQTTCRTVLQFTGQSTMPKQLQRIWEGVNLASEAVDKLLEKQRQQSPRLWFLTDSDLTKALSAVQKLAGPETEEVQGQTEAKAVDVAAGKTLAAFATHFFPWIDKATTWLGPDDGGQNKKARRRSSAGHMMREEVDRALNRKAIGDLDISLIALKPPAPHSAPENEDAERPKAKPPVQGERLATELKSALMGPIQAKPRPFSGPAHHVHHPHPHGLTSIMDDVAASIGEQVDGHGTTEQFTEMQGHQGCLGSQRWEWARNLVLTSNEELHLSWPAWCCGRGALLGNWLLAAEKTMQEFLQMQIKQVFKKICESNLVDAVSEWLNEGEGVPGQALLLGLQLFFMNAMEISMDVEDEAGVAMVFGQVDEMLEGLQQALPRLLSMPSLPNTRRLVLGDCWLQALNWQEQLSALKRAWKGAKTRESFQWKRFLRQRWDMESASVIVACVDWSIPYGYEYVGSATAFVRTPQTDRAFVSFASALRQGHAAIGLEGPPGSGKVEMVSELARAVAVPLLKAAGTLNVLGMLQFLAGVATTNAWGFMRMSDGETSGEMIDCKSLALLATMADALQTLLSAARANKQEVRLGPYEVRCTRRPKAFFFVLPSLSDLPYSLVAELRPISITQPPLGRVVEVLLQVEGFEPEAAERFANGLLSKAHEIVIAGSGQQNLQSCGLRRLRHAVAAAGKARRRDATMADTVLSAVLALSPGEGSLHRRSLLGAEGNAVLSAQSQLVSLLAEGKEPSSEEPLASSGAQRLAREVETFCKDFGLSPGGKYQSIDVEEGSSRLALAAVEVYEHVANGRATVVMGPTSSGKSTLLKAMQAASCQGDPLERSQEVKELCLWYVYPQALADEEGGAGELTFRKMMSCLLRTISERDSEGVEGAEGEAISQQQNLIVFDGEVDERWSDDVWPLLSTRQISSTEGVYTQLPLSTELLFETRSLEKASPAFCSQCALCPVQEMLDIQNLLEAFANRIGNGFAGKAARIHSSTLLGWLARLASGITELKGVQEGFNEMVAADQLLHMLEATWRAALPMDDLEGEEGVEEQELSESEMALLEVWSIYCAAWVLGGPLHSQARRRLGAWLLTSFEGADGLPRGYSVLGSQVHSDPENLWKFRIASNAAGLAGLRDAVPKTSVKLLCDVLPEPEEFDEQSIFLPAEEREAVRLFVRHQVYVDCRFGFRLWGPQNGKSALGEELVRSMASMSERRFELLRCPHRLSAGGFSEYIEAKMSRKGTLTLSSMPARKMCIIVDDVHLGSFGTKEQLRQVLERGHLTGAAAKKQGGTWHALGLWLGAIERDAGNTGERWLRHFLALQNPDLSETSLRDVCTRLVQRWYAQVPSEEARIMLISRSFPERVVKVILEAAKTFGPVQPFAISPFLDLTRWFQSISQYAKNIISTLDLQRIVWHEGMLQLGERLETTQDRQKLRDILADAGLTFLSDEEVEDPLFLDNGEPQDLGQMTTAQSWIRRNLAGILNTFGMPMVIFKDMVLAILSASRALQAATPTAPSGALFLGAVGSGRRTCAQMASHLVNGELQRCTAEDVPRLIEEIRQFCKTGSDMGLQCLGPITQDLLTLADGELALEEIDDSLRGATDIKVEKKLMQVASPSGAVEVPKARAFRRRGENEPVKYDGATRLAFILCLSPTSNADWFRRQLARFPSLGSKISPVWIQPWGEDAYFEVARTSFTCEFEGTAYKQADSIHQNVASAAMQMAQVAVGEIGSQRQLPGGCALYISVVIAAKELFKAKEEELQKENNKLTKVVESLVQMEKTLRHFETKHGMAFQQVKESDKMNKELAEELEKVEAQAIQASDNVKTLNAEAQEIEEEVKRCTLIVEDATAAVKQNLAMAGLKLRGLPSSNIHECRNARQPSAALERVTFATLSALEIEESWSNVVKLLLTDFITRLEEVDVAGSSERAALVHERLEELQALGGLVDEPGRVLGEALAEWLHAFVASARTWKSVEDDVATLKKAEGCYQQKVKEGERAEEALDALTDQILDIKQKIETRQSDRAKARGSIQYSNEELDGVASIREFVSCDEVLAWHTRHKDMDRQMAQLPGKFLLGSFLAHYGCFLKEKKDDVLAQWQTICEQEELVEADDHELSADCLLYMMAESCKVQDLELPDGSVGHFPVQWAASLFCSRRPVPLLLDPLGIARQWLDKQLPVMTASICSEIVLTSCLGAHPMEDIQAASKSKSSSLLIRLGEEFSKASDDPPQLHAGLQSWLQSQKDLPPGQLFLLSNGTRAPKSYENVGFVINCCDLQALQEYILAETIEIADGQLFRLLGEATNKQWMALSNEKTLNEDMLTKVAADREHTIPLDVALAQEMLKMKQHHVEYAEEQKAAANALYEMQAQILPWRRFAAKAASIVEVAMAMEEWHPLYQGEGQSCLQWLWHYLRTAVSDKIPVDELTTELPRAWVAAAASHTFPKHHPSLVCSVAFATNSRNRLEGIFSAALRRSANGEDESEEKEATSPQPDDTLGEDLEELQDVQDDGEPLTRPAAPAECAGFISDKGWSRLTDYKDAFADLWKVSDSMVKEPARWNHLKANPEEAFPVEIAPVEELLTFAALAPERLEEKLLHLSIKELGTPGVEILSASKGPVALVTEAVQDARSDSPPKPILFLTEEEPGFDSASTVRMTLQSLAAQMDVPFQAVSLLDPLCAAQVGAAHLRFQEQQAGWLLLEDTLDESLMTLETRHPQLLKRLDAMMDLAGKASRSSTGSHLGPAVVVAVHYSYRPQKSTSFCSLLHLVPKASRLASRRVFVSWPIGFMANIRAVEADIKSVKDAEPEHETAHDNLSHLSSLHALLQHRSRMGDIDATNSSWLLEKEALSHKADQTQAEQKPNIASLCKDVLSNSWPANLWAVLPEKLASNLESLGWPSLQQAMQEALQKHQRKRRKRTSRTSNRALERRVYSLCWRSQSASLPDRRFGASLLEDVALVTDSRL